MNSCKLCAIAKTEGSYCNSCQTKIESYRSDKLQLNLFNMKLDYKAIYKEYDKDKVSLSFLGEKYGVTKQAISHAFKKFNLKTRSYTAPSSRK